MVKRSKGKFIFDLLIKTERGFVYERQTLQ